MIKLKNIGLSLAVSALVGPSAMAINVPAYHDPIVKEEIVATDTKEGDSKAEIAKKLANPVAAMISLPIQYNFDRGFLNTSGTDSNKMLVNVQPVIPISLNEDWNIISRTIVPLVRTDDIPLHSGINYGVSDIVQSVFFSPKAPTEDGWIWGAGPVFLLSSGSNMSAKKWGAGPTAVALKQSDSLTYGVLANHIWSVGGSDKVVDNFSQTFVQPFLTFTTPEAYSLILMTETTYNWEAKGDNQWSIPLFLEVTKVSKIGEQIINFGGGVKYYAKSPDGGPQGWGVRVVLTFMFAR